MHLRRLAPLAFVLVTMAASAQMYSWRDASGKIHYSDEPPPDKSATRKVAPPATGVGDPDARKAALEQDAAMRKRQKESQEAAAKSEKETAEAAQRKVECERARGNLQGIQSGQIRFTTNAQGDRVGLEGEAREAELANARKAVDSWCK